MRGGLFLTCLAAGVLAAGAACAASFDCARAQSRVEKAVCADAQLSKLDSDLAAAYRDTLAVTVRPATVRAEQREWVRQNLEGATWDDPPHPFSVEDLRGRYGARIDELRTARDLDTLAKSPFPAKDLARRCAPLGIEACKVERSGAVQGGQGLVFQVQASTSEDEFRRGVIVFAAGPGGTLTPVAWAASEAVHYDDPEVVRSAAGRLLVLPGTQDGTGAFNAESLYRQDGTGWRDVELVSWRRELKRRTPKDLGVWKGVAYDFPSLTASTGLWRSGDANCCATGGSADITFAVEGDALVVKAVKVNPPEPDAGE
jgi:uncharacterized protein